LGTASQWDLPLLAEMDAEPIGLAWGRIDDLHPDVGHLYQLWVAPDYRGLGAGRMLLDAVIAWARTANVERVALDVTCGDTPAPRLYARAGFVPVGDPQPLRAGSELLKQPMQLSLNSGPPSGRTRPVSTEFTPPSA
jgi:GNAT superfamily N-acetyltransferase